MNQLSAKKLSDILDFRNGINFEKKQKGIEGLLTIDVMNMYGKGIFVDLSKLYRINAPKRNFTEFLLEPGDLLFVRSSLKREGAGWTSLFYGNNEPVTFCGFIIRGRIKNLNEIFPEFLTHYLRSTYARNQIIANAGQVVITNISQDNLGNVKILIPAIAEQKEIAQILSDVDEAIIKSEQLINRTGELKRNLMSKLLSDGINNKEFKESKLGQIPKDWEVKPLYEIGKIITGKTPLTSKKEYWNGDIPFVTPLDISTSKYINKTERFVTEKGARTAMSLLPINSLSVVCIASIGKIGILTHKCITNQQINSIIIDESKYNVNYMYYALSNMTKKLISTAGNVVVPIIKKSLFEKFLIKIPKFEEQNSIANILSEFDNKIDLHKMQKEHYKNIKYGLMNDLLTGKKRVKIN